MTRVFTFQPGTGTDWSRTVAERLRSCDGRDCVLHFEPGIYEFSGAPENRRFAAISNHTSGKEHPFAVILDGCADVRIEGEPGTRLVMAGKDLIPFRISRSKRIVLAGLELDVKENLYSSGQVVRADEESFDVCMTGGCRCEVCDGILLTDGEPFWGVAELDEHDFGLRRGSALNFQEDYPARVPVRSVGENTVRFSGRLRGMPRAGATLIFRHGKRDTPAIFMEESVDLAVEHVTLRRSAGMGILAQGCRDLRISSLNVALPPEGERHVTLTADAIHLVNCSGSVRIEHCVLEHQYDDAVNIHGIYSFIQERRSATEYVVERRHRAQAGVPLFTAENRLAVYEAGSLEPIAQCVAAAVQELDLRHILLSLSEPAELPIGAVLENLSRRPSLVVIEGNRMRFSNPRGILASSGEEILIADNEIDTPYACVFVPGGADDWCESGAVKHLTIRGNTFTGCYGAEPSISKAVIDIRPFFSRKRQTPFHGKIEISGNTLRNPEACFCHAEYVRELILADNRAADGTALHYELCTETCGAVSC